MQITYRIPSKVPYGYAEVTFNEGEIPPDPLALAEEYANYVLAYKGAEEKALTAPNSKPIKAKPPVTRSISEIMSDEDVDTEKEAAALKAAEDLIIKNLGGVKVDEETAPWDNPPETEPKEWTPPASDAWDFS